ncbi:MAG: hypothetical protein J6J36_04230 [Clostridia bacterium]|nr:hypothetical protein [Clostridia bacterium]
MVDDVNRINNSRNTKEQRFLDNLVILGKKISIEAATNQKLEDRIKKMSSY